mmetsp:Transcript_31077/g.69004  ORF Transcript_31077/g.69004 Transcript_31077/m.69004 type:complete len:204 (-) Transcript_31077:621-1232(-)|eukprot:CAMPEP_0202903310 /NCGR_PEP_ID=MMETSP1392-20130828/23831_1 /ASSEMBLY_ACC=CAM_ASM_000868 /TAXON_ID=225041 /ORGANISM="Chlamydomonas chlamydogama, Strain SAG 11-48b" /LENGTH=203 /DNA_ID=CAMNT_0049590429 /DNA_START=200 /DNA_END=811 /DNA_ORIENTATION=+
MLGNHGKTSNGVFLNVYDLASQNSWSYWCGIGVFHTGVEVYGVEYAYGGHEYDCSGVFATNPRDAPGQVLFRESIYMGETDLTAVEVQQLVSKLGQEYKGNRYHLLQRNCNHFAGDLCYQLTGKPPPAWINRLASVAVMLHCLLPASWVPPLMTPSVIPDAAVREDKEALIMGPRSDLYRPSPPMPQGLGSSTGATNLLTNRI